MTQAKQKKQLELLAAKDKRHRLKIASGAIFKTVSRQESPISDVAIACQLNLSVPLVRQELHKLVESGVISVRQSPSQGLDSPCLVYEAAF